MNELPPETGTPTPDPTPTGPSVPGPAPTQEPRPPAAAPPAEAQPAAAVPSPVAPSSDGNAVGGPAADAGGAPASPPASPPEADASGGLAADTGAAQSGPRDGPAEGGEPRKRRRRRRKSRPDGQGATDAEGAPAEGAPADGAEAMAAPVGEPSDASGDRPPRKKKRRKKGAKPESATSGASRPGSRKPGFDEGRPGARKGPRRPEHVGTIAVRALSEMARALLDAEGVDPFGRPRWLDLRIKVPLEPERDAARAAADVVDQLVARVEDVRRHESALKPGSVYCYFNDSAQAPTSRPQKPREVFDGFGSTGRPNFTDFVTLAIERRDAGIDDLVNGEDVVVTHVSMGRVLRTQQLQEFGSESPVYRILGQVDAGLYAMLGSDQKAAFSFQLLKGTTLDGMSRFRLHWVGAADVRDIADPMVGGILKRFQQALDRESLRYSGMTSNGNAPDEEEFVLPLLQELAKRLAGRARQTGRRTEHATQRSDERQRPTAKVWDDAKEAGDEHILRDDEQSTIVVIGPKNRVHVFSFDARHVTSFVMPGGHVHKRKAEGRWHPAEPEERGEFRIALKRRLKEGVETAEDSEPPAS